MKTNRKAYHIDCTPPYIYKKANKNLTHKHNEKYTQKCKTEIHNVAILQHQTQQILQAKDQIIQQKQKINK